MQTDAAAPSAAPSPRRRAKAETQERILAASIALFAERGFERTSISAIASRAGVSRSALFWHFGDKEGLFREAFRRMLVPFFEEFKASLEHLDARKRVYEIFAAYERVVEEHEGTIRSIVRWLLESEKLRASLLETLFHLHDEFIRDVRLCFEELHGGAESGALAAAVVALLDGNLLLTLLDPDPRSRELRRSGLRALTRRVLGEANDR